MEFGSKRNNFYLLGVPTDETMNRNCKLDYQLRTSDRKKKDNILMLQLRTELVSSTVVKITDLVKIYQSQTFNLH
jgi:hypothetical protein